MRVIVVGAGAVGLGLGSCLLSAGEELCFVARSSALRTLLAARGFERRGIFGEARHPPDVFELVASIDELSTMAFDCILVCTKSTASREVAQNLRALQADDLAPVVLCQNGWGNAEIFAEQLPRESIWNARVITGFRLPAANRVEITVHAEPLRVGSLFVADASPLDPVIDRLCASIDGGGLPCERSAAIEEDLLAKLLYNCALNPLGAILGLPYGALGAREETRELIVAVVHEIFEVLGANGLSTHWKSADDYLHAFFSKLLPPTASHESSMLQDLRAGRATEIEALCGAVVALGERSSLATPVNRALLELIRGIQASKAQRVTQKL